MRYSNQRHNKYIDNLANYFVTVDVIDDVYTYTHRCDIEIETGSSWHIGRENMPLLVDKLPISHNNVVGENTVLYITQHFGDWCSHTRGSEFISNST